MRRAGRSGLHHRLPSPCIRLRGPRTSRGPCCLSDKCTQSSEAKNRSAQRELTHSQVWPGKLPGSARCEAGTTCGRNGWGNVLEPSFSSLSYAELLLSGFAQPNPNWCRALETEGPSCGWCQDTPSLISGDLKPARRREPRRSSWGSANEDFKAAPPSTCRCARSCPGDRDALVRR